MANLENLKKQAKLSLRWHRDRYWPVAEQIRAVLPRFRGLDDEAVLAHRFRLADAQELIASKTGFGSWEALVKGVDAMTDEQEVLPKPTLLGAEPQLFVGDVGAACDFYVGKLGFAVVFSYGEPAFYAQVVRDGVRLNLRHVDEPVMLAEVRTRERLLSASITVDAVKLLFLEFEAAGVAFAQTLRTEPWGARTFVVGDPDGNLILFAG